MGTAGAGPVVGLLLAHTSVAFARCVEDRFYSETQRQDISVEVFLGFDAAVHTPAPWLLPRGASTNQDLSPSQQERGCYGHKLTAEGSPKHTISFLAKRQGLRGKLAEAQRRKGPEQSVLLGNTHLVFSGRRAPPVPNFSCRLRTSRGGFTAEFTKAILATLPTGVQKETVLRSSLTQSRLFGICLTAASSQHLSPARPSQSPAQSLLLRSAPLQSHCLL